MAKADRGAWWVCHWCVWESRVAWWRPFDRWFATRAFRRHLRAVHPDVVYHNEALWGRRGVGPSTGPIVEDRQGVHVVAADGGGPVTGVGPLMPSTMRPEPELSGAQAAAFEVVKRQALADARREEARVRAELTGRVRAALESQMAGEFMDPDDAESMQRAAEVAVSVFVEFLQTPPGI